MLWPLLLLFACQTNQPPGSYQELITSQNCAKADNIDACRAKECNVFYQKAIIPRSQDTAALSALCTLSEISTTTSAQSCGFPACLQLPTVSPTAALKLLQQNFPKKHSQKMARKAILRGFLQQPQRFQQLLEDQGPKKNWLGIAMAEADCGENSAAKLLHLPCGGPYPKAARAAYDYATQQMDSTAYAAFSLAVTLSPKNIIPKLLSRGLSKQQNINQRKASLSAVQTAMARGYKIDANLRSILLEKCQTAEAAMASFCHNLAKEQ